MVRFVSESLSLYQPLALLSVRRPFTPYNFATPPLHPNPTLSDNKGGQGGGKKDSLSFLAATLKERLQALLIASDNDTLTITKSVDKQDVIIQPGQVINAVRKIEERKLSTSTATSNSSVEGIEAAKLSTQTPPSSAGTASKRSYFSSKYLSPSTYTTSSTASASTSGTSLRLVPPPAPTSVPSPAAVLAAPGSPTVHSSAATPPNGTSESPLPSSLGTKTTRLLKSAFSFYKPSTPVPASPSAPSPSIARVDQPSSISQILPSPAGPVAFGVVIDVQTPAAPTGRLSPLKLLSEKLDFDDDDDDEEDDEDDEGKQRGAAGGILELYRDLVDSKTPVDEANGSAAQDAKDGEARTGDETTTLTDSDQPIAPAEDEIGKISEISLQQIDISTVETSIDDVQIDKRENSITTDLSPKEDISSNSNSNESNSSTKDENPINSTATDGNISEPNIRSLESNVNGNGDGLPNNETLSSADIQNRIVAAIISSLKAREVPRVVGIYSCTACPTPSCGFQMLDEEVMAAWIKVEAEQEIFSTRLGPQKIRGRDPHSVEALGSQSQSTLIDCPNCGDPFWPFLTVRCLRLRQQQADDGSEFSAGSGEGGALAAVWEERVSHLSPFELRTHLEAALLGSVDKKDMQLEEVGAGVGAGAGVGSSSELSLLDRLRSGHPSLYWSLLWFSTLWRLPSGLKGGVGTAEADVGCPVICGWRKSVVEARAISLLVGDSHLSSEETSSSGPGSGSAGPGPGPVVSSNIGLQLKDVFPEWSPADIQQLYSSVIEQHKLDGSLVRMREAMLDVAKSDRFLQLSSLPSSSSAEVSPQRARGLSNARFIYLTLLTLAFLYSQNKMLSLPERVVPKTLTKPFPFDRIFKDTIKCVLSRGDFLQMKTTEKEMIKSVATPEVQATRIAFGSLF